MYSTATGWTPFRKTTTPILQPLQPCRGDDTTLQSWHTCYSLASSCSTPSYFSINCTLPLTNNRLASQLLSIGTAAQLLVKTHPSGTFDTNAFSAMARQKQRSSTVVASAGCKEVCHATGSHVMCTTRNLKHRAKHTVSRPNLDIHELMPPNPVCPWVGPSP